MNIVQLAYLCALKKCGSVTSTAEKFFISHQGLSKAIRNIENELSTTLITRSSKGVTLTEDGLFVVEKAKNILKEYNEIQKKFFKVESATNISGTVSIVSISRIIDSHLNLILPKFRKLYPNIKISIKSLQHDDILNTLSDDSSNIDIGLLTLNENDFKDSRVRSEIQNRGCTLTDFSCEEIFACTLKNKQPKDIATLEINDQEYNNIASYSYSLSISKRKTKKLYSEINSAESQRTMVENDLAIGMTTNREFELFYAKKKKFALIPMEPPVLFYFCYLTATNRPLSLAAKTFLTFFNKQYNYNY